MWQVELAYLMDQSRGRIRLEHRGQEMTNSNPSPPPPPGSFGVPGQGLGDKWGWKGGGVKLGLHVVLHVPESWLQHTQDLLDVTWTVSSFSYKFIRIQWRKKSKRNVKIGLSVMKAHYWDETAYCLWRSYIISMLIIYSLEYSGILYVYVSPSSSVWQACWPPANNTIYAKHSLNGAGRRLAPHPFLANNSFSYSNIVVLSY